ncbi:hypothetical protein ColTof3_13961 [Colletotrichum tofieldiae]|nr:hypothetical protein ColTof3_13961 [Colletotrichum tofieldiae]
MPPPTTAAVSGLPMPPSSSLHGSPSPGITSNEQELNRTSQPLPNSTPQGQQPFPVAGGKHPAQFSQMPPPSNQRSSMPFSGYNQPYPSQGPHDQGQQSSVSKWFKNRTSTQPAPSQSYQGHAKDSAAKSIFSAFKRSSKQPEPRPPQQQQMTQSQAQRSPIKYHLLAPSLNGTPTRRKGTILCINNNVQPHHLWALLVSDLLRSMMHPEGALMLGRLASTCHSTRDQQSIL